MATTGRVICGRGLQNSSSCHQSDISMYAACSGFAGADSASFRGRPTVPRAARSSRSASRADLGAGLAALEAAVRDRDGFVALNAVVRLLAAELAA